MAANSIAKLAVLITGDASPLQASLRSAGQAVQQFSAVGGGGTGGMAGMASMAGPIAAAGAAALAAATALIAFGKAGVQAASSMEQARISFEVFTGSAATGLQMVNDLRSFAAETPMNFTDIQQAAKVLMAMGEDSRLVIDDLEMLGNVAAGSGQNLTELAQVFGQVMQAGRLTGNELRQFNERGVPLLTTLASQMGVTKQAIREMVEAGTLSSADVVKAFKAMTSEGGLFANMMGRQTDTLSGQWEKFKENLTIISSETMKNFSVVLKDILVDVNALLDAMVKWLGIERQKSSESQEQAKHLRAKIDAENAAAKAAEESNKKHQEALKETEKAFEKAKSRAQSIAESMRTPNEIFRDTMRELNSLIEAGLLGLETYNRAARKAKEDLADALEAKEKLKKEVDTRVGAVERFTMAGFSAMQRTNEKNKIEDNTNRTAENTAKANKTLEEIARMAGYRPPALTVSNF